MATNLAIELYTQHIRDLKRTSQVPCERLVRQFYVLKFGKGCEEWFQDGGPEPLVAPNSTLDEIVKGYRTIRHRGQGDGVIITMLKRNEKLYLDLAQDAESCRDEIAKAAMQPQPKSSPSADEHSKKDEIVAVMNHLDKACDQLKCDALAMAEKTRHGVEMIEEPEIIKEEDWTDELSAKSGVGLWSKLWTPFSSPA